MSDQLQPDDTLVDRGVADVLDDGYVPPDGWSPGAGSGNTAAQQAQGETLEQRVKQEIPDDWDGGPEYADRAGRLVGPGLLDDPFGSDDEPELLATDVGIDGGAASAEEAAMHVIGGDDLY